MRKSLPTIKKSTALPSESTVKELLTLSGSAIINHILDEKNPRALVRRLAEEDFFWIVKKIGEADSLPVLQLASEDQWEYLLDLLSWDRDRLDTDSLLSWFSRLAEADSERFAVWLFNRGEALFSLLINARAEVVYKEGEEEADLPAGYFTLDGFFYIRPRKMEDREAIEGLLRTLAQQDYQAMQSLLFNLAAHIPAELEEELYRLRNVRLAEHGFLPHEEALAVYAPLAPEVLGNEQPPLLPGRIFPHGDGALLPFFPLRYLEDSRLLAGALSQIADPLLQDRLRLEFAGLCNQIIAAGAQYAIEEVEELADACRRAASYLNLALESLCSHNLPYAAEFLSRHPLLTIFRIGYGFAMKLQWQAKKWRKESWFFRQGKENDFWDTPWGETLAGLAALRPQFFAGEDSREPLRDFRSVADLEKTRQRLLQIQALDCLLARISQEHSEEAPLALPETFHPLLFNRFARSVLGGKPSPAPLTRTEQWRFFQLVRRNDSGRPYRQTGFRERFRDDFLKYAPDFDSRSQRALKEALAQIWEAFCGEYENVAAEDLDDCQSRYLWVV